MAGYATNPTGHWLAQVFLAGCYVLSVALMAHAAYGIARTVAVRLPLRENEQGLPVDLFVGEYGPRLRSYDSPGRKSLKNMVLAAVMFVMCASWVIVLTATYRAGDPLFGWTLLGETGAAALHTGVLVILCVLAARRGVRGADRRSVYSLPHPFTRLVPYLEERIAAAGLRSSNKPVYGLSLPVRGTVDVSEYNGKVLWLVMSLPGDRRLRIGPETELSGLERLWVDRILRDNGF